MKSVASITQTIYSHPWEPFIPAGARIVMLGTFPPKEDKWSMDFFYPNFQNDFWRIMGLIFLGNKEALYDDKPGKFNLEAIKSLMNERRIAIYDTARTVRRLKDNASDKFLEIVDQVDLKRLLAKMPECRAIAATGEKASGVIAAQMGISVPKTGEMEISGEGFHIWRMPSSSRAYPLKVEAKAEYYRRMLESEGIV